MTERLPELLDCRGLQHELGVKRATAESLMQSLPKFRIGRRVFVRRADVREELERRELTPEGFPRSAA